MNHVERRIDRDRYLAKLIDRKWNGAVKIVSGVRRCGKSYLLNVIFREHLLSEGVPGDHILQFALDSPECADLLDGRALYDRIRSMVADDDDHYVILDEVQLVDGFESAVNGLLRMRNVDVYVTGSDSRFLTTDVVTAFRGRGDEVRLYPLSFGEFLSVFDGPGEDAWDEYILNGGMPGAVAARTQEQKGGYLSKLMREVYIKDIEEHGGIGNIAGLEGVIGCLFSSVGSLTNPHRIAGTYVSKGVRGISDATVSSYLRLLEECYLFERAKRFDIKGRAYLDTPSKYYAVDVGLRNAWLNYGQHEEARLMENVIYNELRSRGFSVDVGVVTVRTMEGGDRRSESYEIDFVANMGDRRYYIQSAFDLGGEGKREREVRPFLRVDDSFRKILVTRGNARPIYDRDGVMTVGIRRFLTDESLLGN